MNMTGKQWLAIIGAVLSALVVSTAQLTDLFGAAPAKYIVSAAGFVNMILQAVTAALSGQVSMAKDLQAAGVKMQVPPDAPPALVSLAKDEAQPNIEIAK